MPERADEGSCQAVSLQKSHSTSLSLFLIGKVKLKILASQFQRATSVRIKSNNRYETIVSILQNSQIF